MITIFVDPNDGNQVMAYYRDCKPGNPSIWTDQGFAEVQIAEESPLYRNLLSHQRDCEVVVDADGVITSCTSKTNELQLEPNAVEIRQAELRASGRAKLLALGLTEDEINVL